MKRIIYWFLVLYSSFASSATKESINKVESVLMLSGIREQILGLEGRLPYPMKESIQQTFPTDELRDKFTKIGLAEFKPRSILDMLKIRMDEEFSKNEIVELDKYFNLPETRKFSILEEKASSPEGREASMECVSKLKNRILKQERIDLIREYIVETQMNIYNANITMEMLKAIGVGVGNTLSSENIEKTEKLFQVAAENWNLAFFYCMYENVEHDILKKNFSNYKNNKNIKKLIRLLYEEQKKYYVSWGMKYGRIVKEQYVPPVK